jgi:DNA-binding winged helix-turn-helix (wHTH) protein
VKDTNPARVRFGAFELDLHSGELSSGPANGVRSATVLAQQPFHLLLMLVEREGAMLSREEIQARFWPNDTIVEFNHSINVAIGKLRKALGDAAGQPQYIATVASRGYRLMVPVEWIALAEDSPRELLPQVVDDVGSADRSTATVHAGQTVSHYRVLDIIGGGGMGHIMTWPTGQSQPVVSALNASDGAVTSNMAIVPTTNGSVHAFATDPTNLLPDIASYFAP